MRKKYSVYLDIEGANHQSANEDWEVAQRLSILWNLSKDILTDKLEEFFQMGQMYKQGQEAFRAKIDKGHE